MWLSHRTLQHLLMGSRNAYTSDRMGRADSIRISVAEIQAFLRKTSHPDATVTATKPLGETEGDEIKGYGYGKPLRITFTSQGKEEQVVLRTMSPDPFGHDRRADRIDAMALSFDTFNQVPRHIQALDVGVFNDAGELVSLPRGEPFLLTTYVDGDLYAKDLFALKGQEHAAPTDVARAQALALYLADLHKTPAQAAQYRRSIRDTLCAGEGILGQIDGYPKDHPVATSARLRKLEEAALRWRWQLNERGHRARRTHGDFHPFNILFRQGTDLSVLDCSRGGVGEPADDVTCLSVNYLFIALTHRSDFGGAHRQLWKTFWDTYLAASGDHELLQVVAPFFAWRLLVVASPLWYPHLDNALRDRLLRLAERLLAGTPFDPAGIDGLSA